MERTKRYLTLEDRQTISRLHLRGQYPAEIAEAIGVAAATVYAELKRGWTGEYDKNGRYDYSPEQAQARFMEGLRNRGRKPAAAE